MDFVYIDHFFVTFFFGFFVTFLILSGVIFFTVDDLLDAFLIRFLYPLILNSMIFVLTLCLKVKVYS